MEAFFFLVSVLFVASSDAVEKNSTSKNKIPKWADEDRLGQYQDVWKSLNQENSTIYYLAKATYENDTASWGEKFSCVSVRETGKNEREKSVTSVFSFWNATRKTGPKFIVSEKVVVTKNYNYEKTPNAIKYIAHEGGNLTDTLVFTDGETCDVFYVPYSNGGKGGYELWVNAENITNIPTYCTFILDYFRKPNSRVYDIYTKEKCTRTQHLHRITKRGKP